MIEFRGISKTYLVSRRGAGLKSALAAFARRERERVEALTDVSFQIGGGEIVGYIGPNGAGKSTTIKIMSGILHPTRGECEILGRVPWRERIAHVREIGVVFGQRSQLMWDIPAIDTFGLLKDIYRIPADAYRESLRELTDTFELGDLLGVPVRQLSLGQRMRLEVAASLLHRPKILFLDEPTIGLDAVSKVAVREHVKRINRERGVTVVLTTHDMGDVEALTDRVILIGKGRILYDGSFAAMRGRYDAVGVIAVESDRAAALDLPEGATLVSYEGGRSVIHVDARVASIPKVIARLAEAEGVRDIQIKPRPIEEIIAEIYRGYSL